MSLRNKAITGFFWSFLEKFSLKGIGFIVSIILARLILPKEFGLIGLSYVFMGIGNVLINAGLVNSLIRSKNLSEKDYSTVFLFNIVSSFVFYIILFFVAPFVAKFYNQNELILIFRLYSLTFFIDALGSIHKTKLTIDLNFKKQMTITFPALILSSFVSIFLAFKNYGVWSLVWGAIVYSFFVTLQYWILTTWQPTLVFCKIKFKEHFLFGYKLTLAGLVNIIFNNVYYIIIGKFFNINLVGYYQRAESMKDMPVSNLSMVLDKITYPIFAKIQDNQTQLRLAYKQVMQLAIFFIAPTMVILIIIAKPLFIALFTEKWAEAAPLFQIMAIASILYPIQVYNFNILKVKGRTDLVLKMVLFSRGLTIILIFLAYNFGIYTLLWTQVLAALIFFIIYSYISGKFINYSTLEQFKDIFPSLALASLMAVFVQIIYSYIQNFNNILIITLVIISGYSVFLITAYLLKMNQIQLIKELLFKSKKI